MISKTSKYRLVNYKVFSLVGRFMYFFMKTPLYKTPSIFSLLISLSFWWKHLQLELASRSFIGRYHLSKFSEFLAVFKKTDAVGLLCFSKLFIVKYQLCPLTFFFLRHGLFSFIPKKTSKYIKILNMGRQIIIEMMFERCFSYLTESVGVPLIYCSKHVLK